jgi:hypothetical protein
MDAKVAPRPIHVRGGVFRCPATNTLLFQHPTIKDAPMMTYKDLSCLLVEVNKDCNLLPGDFHKGTVLALWSIGSLEDARACKALLPTAVNALSRSVNKARQSNSLCYLSTQGLARQLVKCDSNNHAFGHPAVKDRCVEFEVFPFGKVFVCAEFQRLLEGVTTFTPEMESMARDEAEALLYSLSMTAESRKQYMQQRQENIQAIAKQCVACGNRGHGLCPGCGERFCSRECHKSTKCA